jgi:hypothetical protein
MAATSAGRMRVVRIRRGSKSTLFLLGVRSSDPRALNALCRAARHDRHADTRRPLRVEGGQSVSREIEAPAVSWASEMPRHSTIVIGGNCLEIRACSDVHRDVRREERHKNVGVKSKL